MTDAGIREAERPGAAGVDASAGPFRFADVPVFIGLLASVLAIAMAVVRPFRGLRPVPSRVDPGGFVAGTDVDEEGAKALLARDPRNVVGLLRSRPARARFLVQEQLRAGVVARDALPSLYVLKVQGAETSRMGFFAVVRADSMSGGDEDSAGAARLKETGLVVEPVVVRYVDKKGRVARSLESETEREPDATFSVDGKACELWAVDDDSAAARVTALVEGAALTVAAGENALARQRGMVEEDNARGFALAFFVDDEAPVERVPLGVVLHSLEGPLGV